LHVACVRGHVTIADYLIHSGADKDARTFVKAQFIPILFNSYSQVTTHVHHFQSDFTPLHYASEYGHLQIAQLLINKGADFEAKGGHVSIYAIYFSVSYNLSHMGMHMLGQLDSSRMGAKPRP
jgi:ankyrin repeat protein